MNELRVLCTEYDGYTIVELGGELDIATAPALCAELDAWVAGGGCRLIIDLATLEFLDAAGLGALVHVRAAAVERMGWARLVRVRPKIQRVLRLARLTRVLPQFASLELALRHIPQTAPADGCPRM